MKKLSVFLFALVVLMGCNKPGKVTVTDGITSFGAVNSKFSVAPDRQVMFSRGNLQYQPSTATWRMAETQFESMGSDNENISPYYPGWIDLFGWATSGYDCGNTYFMPYDSETGADADGFGYGPLPMGTNLVGDYANCDWGVYAKISNASGQWRTLTHNEWKYLMEDRADAAKKYGIANVAGKNGLVLLPDEFTLPEGLKFTPGLDANDGTKYFAMHNPYTEEQWIEMQKAGAVFLPVTGSRQPYAEMAYVNEIGKYWSVTCCQKTYFEDCVYCLTFESSYMSPDDNNNPRDYGRAVRLVHDCE